MNEQISFRHLRLGQADKIQIKDQSESSSSYLSSMPSKIVDQKQPEKVQIVESHASAESMFSKNYQLGFQEDPGVEIDAVKLPKPAPLTLAKNISHEVAKNVTFSIQDRFQSAF